MTDNTYLQAKEEAGQNLFKAEIDNLQNQITQLNKRLETLQKRLGFFEDKFDNHRLEIDAHKEPIKR